MSSSLPQAILLYGANYRNRTNNLLITSQLRCQLRQIGIWWTVSGSNRWPPACRAGVLPAELTAHMAVPMGAEPTSIQGQRIILTDILWNQKFYVFILFYSTPAIFLRGHSMHTGRLYSCFDFTGSSLRPKLSNRCFGSYSDIQLVCVDINIDSHNYNYLPANEIFGLRHYPCLFAAIEISLTNNCSHLTQATFLWVYLPWMIL